MSIPVSGRIATVGAENFLPLRFQEGLRRLGLKIFSPYGSGRIATVAIRIYLPNTVDLYEYKTTIYANHSRPETEYHCFDRTVGK